MTRAPPSTASTKSSQRTHPETSCTRGHPCVFAREKQQAGEQSTHVCTHTAVRYSGNKSCNLNIPRMHACVRVVERAAEIEARMHAVEAESQALKGEAAENFQKQQSLRNELATVKVCTTIFWNAVSLSSIHLVTAGFLALEMCCCGPSRLADWSQQHLPSLLYRYKVVVLNHFVGSSLPIGPALPSLFVIYRLADVLSVISKPLAGRPAALLHSARRLKSGYKWESLKRKNTQDTCLMQYRDFDASTSRVRLSPDGHFSNQFQGLPLESRARKTVHISLSSAGRAEERWWQEKQWRPGDRNHAAAAGTARALVQAGARGAYACRRRSFGRVSTYPRGVQHSKLSFRLPLPYLYTTPQDLVWPV